MDFWKWLQEYLKATFGAENVQIINDGNRITIRFIVPFPEYLTPVSWPVEKAEADVVKEGRVVKIYADMPGARRVYLQYSGYLVIVGEADDKLYVATVDVNPNFRVKDLVNKHGVVKVVLEYV